MKSKQILMEIRRSDGIVVVVGVGVTGDSVDSKGVSKALNSSSERLTKLVEEWLAEVVGAPAKPLVQPPVVDGASKSTKAPVTQSVKSKPKPSTQTKPPAGTTTRPTAKVVAQPATPVAARPSLSQRKSASNSKGRSRKTDFETG